MILSLLSHKIPGGAAFRSLLTTPPLTLPDDEDEWEATFPSIPVPTAMWPMQDAALPLVDTIGTFDLANVNANGAESCLQTGDALGRYSVLFAETDSGVALASSTDLDVTTGDFTIFFRFMVPLSASPASSHHFFRKKTSSSSTAGWVIRHDGSGGGMTFQFCIFPVDTIASATIATDHSDGEWHYCMAVIDRAAAEIRLHTDLGTATTSISGFGGSSLTNAHKFGFGDVHATGAGGAVAHCSYATCWLGEALTQADFDQMCLT